MCVQGITSQEHGAVMLGLKDITQNGWTQQAGATGEKNQVLFFFAPLLLNIIYSKVYGSGGSSVSWSAAQSTVSPLTWLRANFTAPPSVFHTQGTEVNATLNLDVTGLTLGRIFVNGFDLGRQAKLLLVITTKSFEQLLVKDMRIRDVPALLFHSI